MAGSRTFVQWFGNIRRRITQDKGYWCLCLCASMLWGKLSVDWPKETLYLNIVARYFLEICHSTMSIMTLASFSRFSKAQGHFVRPTIYHGFAAWITRCGVSLRLVGTRGHCSVQPPVKFWSNSKLYPIGLQTSDQPIILISLDFCIHNSIVLFLPSPLVLKIWTRHRNRAEVAGWTFWARGYWEICSLLYEFQGGGGEGVSLHSHSICVVPTYAYVLGWIRNMLWKRWTDYEGNWNDSDSTSTSSGSVKERRLMNCTLRTSTRGSWRSSIQISLFIFISSTASP